MGLTLIKYAGYTSVFIFSLLMGMISFIIALPVKAPIVEHTASADTKGFKLSNFFEMRALPISIVMLIVSLAYSGILSFITSYAQEMNLMTASSYYFLVYAVIVFISRPFTGKLMDNRGSNSVAYPALVLFAIGMFMLSQANTNFAFLLAAAVIGLGYGNFQSCAQALAIKVTQPHRMGLANSTYFICMDLGLGVGPLALGFLVPLVGFKGLYSSMVLVILAGIAAYYLLHGRKDKETSPSFNPASSK